MWPVVVFGEEPYAEYAGNVKTIDYVSPGGRGSCSC